MTLHWAVLQADVSLSGQSVRTALFYTLGVTGASLQGTRQDQATPQGTGHHHRTPRIFSPHWHGLILNLRGGRESTSESSLLCLLLAVSAEEGAASRSTSCHGATFKWPTLCRANRKAAEGRNFLVGNGSEQREAHCGFSLHVPSAFISSKCSCVPASQEYVCFGT